MRKAHHLLDVQIRSVERQLCLEKSACDFLSENKSKNKIDKLQWTAKKTDLIELLYALDAAGCFNSGNASLNQIATCFENVFNTDLSHFPRDFYEMRIRNDQTPFMDKLKKLLKKRMDDPKKPYDKG